MDEKEYHDSLASRFKTRFTADMASLKRQIRLVLRDFCSHVPNKEARILDAGCHEGIALTGLRRLGYLNAEGIEYLPLLVRAAQRKKCKVQEGDVHNLCMYKDDVFDVVYSRYLLEHCHTASQVMLELARVLKPDGIIYIIVSSEIDNIPTRQGFTIFKSINDFSTIIPGSIETLSLQSVKSDMGWYDIIYVGRKD
jgi:SAM-dependent methyltransferase